MKKTNLIITSAVASLLISGFVSAGGTTQGPQTAIMSNIGGYAEVDAATGKATLDAGALGKDSEHVSGIRFDGGLRFGPGFSIDGRYEYLEDNGKGSEKSTLDQFRAILNYKGQVSDGLAAFVGGGYGLQNLSVGSDFLKIEADGLMLNVGLEFTNGKVFGSAIYTHGIPNSATLKLGGASIDLPTKDIGYLEGRLGYHLSEQASFIFSLEEQVVGDTAIKKDWVATMGFRFSF